MNIEVMYSIYFQKDRAKRFHPSTFNIRNSAVLRFAFQLRVVSYKFAIEITATRNLYKKCLPVLEVHQAVEEPFFGKLILDLQGWKMHRFIAQAKCSPVDDQ